MAETNLTHDQELEVESHAPYGKVWFALAVFTAIEYGWAHIFKDAFTTLVAGLMFWAVIKASMVGWFFMHLKFEGRWVYYMLVPAGILAAVLTLALVPDLAMQPEADRETPEEEASAGPTEAIGGGWRLAVGYDPEPFAATSVCSAIAHHRSPTVADRPWTAITASES